MSGSGCDAEIWGALPFVVGVGVYVCVYAQADRQTCKQIFICVVYRSTGHALTARWE